MDDTKAQLKGRIRDRNIHWFIKHYGAYRKDTNTATSRAKLWLFMVPPFDTHHFSVLAAVNPQLCDSTVDGISDNKPCFIGMDSCGRLHEDLHNETLIYLRRYPTILFTVLKPITS